MSGVGTGTTTCKEYLFNQLTVFRLRLRVSLEADMRIGHSERLIASPNRRIQAIEVSERATGKDFLKICIQSILHCVEVPYLNSSWKRRPFFRQIFSASAVVTVTTTAALYSLQQIKNRKSQYIPSISVKTTYPIHFLNNDLPAMASLWSWCGFSDPPPLMHGLSCVFSR
jgi:hypothetical protein